MALTQITGPYPIFTDLDGTPLDDGYLYIGEANEDPVTNPVQVFFDANLTIPATQPIRTNNGYAYRNGTPALIYTAGAFSITIRNKRDEFVLYSPVGYGFDPAAVSAAVVQNDFTGDGDTVAFTLSASPSTKLATSVFINGVYQEKDGYNIAGNTLTFTVAPPFGSSIEVMSNETGVIGSTNASLVSYTAGFAGATLQSVQTKLEQYISVKDFGAVGDGVANDTAAFDAAETYLGTVGGGIMFVPSGTYKINWVCTTENIIVQGSGGRGEYDDTCIRPYSLASAPITIGNGTAYVRYVSLLDCHVSGSDGSVSGETTAANNAPQAILLNGGTVNFHADRCVFYNGLKTVSLVPSVTLPVTTNVFLNSTIRNDLTNSANARAIYIIRLADPGYATANKFIATKLNGPTLGYAAEIDGTVAGITFEVNDSYWDIKPAKGVLLKGASGIVCHNFQIDPGTTAAIIIETDNNGDIARFISGLLRHGGQKFKTPAYTYDIPAEADIFSYRQRALSPFLGNDVVFSTTADPYNTSVNLSLQSSTGPLAFYGANFTPGVNNSQSIGNSTNRWSNVYGYNIRAGDGTAFWTTGNGSPEGVVTAPVGSIFTRLNGGALTTLYIKESGAGNTGWVAK